jgi:hypothetical protein
MKAMPRHPIEGDDPEIARLSEMLLAVLGELAIVTDRLDTVERLLEQAGIVPRVAIEAFVPAGEVLVERDQRRARQIAKVLRPLRDDAERRAAELGGNA